MNNAEMIKRLEALASNVDIDSGEELTLNNRTLVAIYKALYILNIKNEHDRDKKTKEKENLVLSNSDTELYETLKDLRNSFAKENGFVAVYTLGTNETLKNIAYHKPTKENFLEIHGVGDFIFKKISDDYISLIESHLKSLLQHDDTPLKIDATSQEKIIVNNPCFDCESEIPLERLENVVNATRCAICQERYELEHPETIARKTVENPIGSREDFKNMSNKQFGTNSKTKF
jgi:RNA polymerase-binding transcription factor DksA